MVNIIDYKKEVQKIYPKSGCCTMTGSLRGVIESVKYIIQTDVDKLFTDCEEDSDFLTDTSLSYKTEEEAWKAAYLRI